MQCSQVLLLLVVVVMCLVHQSNGHYYRRFYYNSRGLYRKLYAGSRYRGYHGGYRRLGGYSLRSIFRSIYNHYKNKADDYDLNTIDNRNDPYNNRSPPPMVIRLPSSVVRNPNFKMSDLPFYLASGLFDPKNFPGSLGSGAAAILGAPDTLPTLIVDPINPTGFRDDNDDLDNDLKQILGGGANTNLLGVPNNVLGGANGNILGVPSNVLGGANGNILGVPSNNVLGVTNNVLGGTNGNLLGGGNSGLLAQGGDPNTDFYNTKTGGIL